MKTVTFYSYKGGSGRSLLLANVAQHLALTGKRVVTLDLDFEAPGLHYKMNLARPGQRRIDIVPERGVVDYVLAANAGNEPARLEDYVVPVALPPGSGELWLMPAGAAPSGDYWRALTKLAKRGMLSDPDGLLIADFLELKFRLEDDLELDYLLIDARTGITELTGITTTLLADTVVCLMLDNAESLAGSRAVLRSLGRAIRLEGQDPVDVVAVLSRVPARDQLAEQRVRAYLVEPGPSATETLSIERLLVLPDEPDAGRAEPSLLDRSRESAESTLGRGFVAMMRKLDPTSSVPTGALQRQQAADAMRSLLTSGSIRTCNGKFVRRSDDQLSGGMCLASTSTPREQRYADLSVVDDALSAVVFVAEYVDDLSTDAAVSWWLRHGTVHELVLFTIDWEGRLQHRQFCRRFEPGPHAKLVEPWFEEIGIA